MGKEEFDSKKKRQNNEGISKYLLQYISPQKYGYLYIAICSVGGIYPKSWLQ